MADKYQNFEALAQAETENVDYRIHSTDRNSKFLVIAPHAGGIEPGTSELAEAIAGSELSFYAFEGIKTAGNQRLHITSTRFNEPTCLELVARADRVIAIHGEDSENEVVYAGGLYKRGLQGLQKKLCDGSFRAAVDGPIHLQGTNPDNICNRGMLRGGVQLELSSGLRRTFFRDLRTRAGREDRTLRFQAFVECVRRFLLDEGVI